MNFNYKSDIIKAVPKHKNKWSIVDIGKSYKGGKDIMVDYKKKQNREFNKLKKLLQEKGETKTIQGYEERIAKVFARYTLNNLQWKRILYAVQGKSGDELEDFMLQLTKLIESYDED